MMVKKIVITGGHFTPGLAIIPLLQKKGWQISWIGEEKAVSGSSTKTIEARVLPGLNIPFYPITAAKLSRHNPFLFLFNLWKIPIGLLQSFSCLLGKKPDVVLSFGSYISFPVSVAALLLGIPIVVHEQTAASGLANRVVAKMARSVAISFESSRKDFPKGKTYLTGNLVRESFYKIAKVRAKRKVNTVPVLFVTGGSRGSRAINNAVFDQIGNLSRKFIVYHQTGALDIDRAKSFVNSNYKPIEFLTPEEMEERFEESDIMVARAGANTVSEIAVCGIPTIFIPLPYAGSDEQTKNAKLLADLGMAKILSQEKLSGETLSEELDDMAANLSSYQKARAKAQALVSKDAPLKLCELIEKAA